MQGVLDIVKTTANRIEQLGNLIVSLCGPQRSGKFTIFKGYERKGSIGGYEAQFSYMPVRRNERGFVEKNGAVLIEVAPINAKNANGNLICNDWTNLKISFALSISDLCQIMDPRTEKLFHKNDKTNTVKTVKFVAGTGKYEGTYMMHISEKAEDDSKNYAVPFSAGEYMVLQRLLVAMAPQMVAWQ